MICIFMHHLCLENIRSQSCLGSHALDADLLAWLQDLPVFALPVTSLTPEHSFYPTTDWPKRPGHAYFEGYFHAFEPEGPRSFRSLHARYDVRGRDVIKPAAPRELRAFLAAVRHRNRFFFYAQFPSKYLLLAVFILVVDTFAIFISVCLFERAGIRVLCCGILFSLFLL